MVSAKNKRLESDSLSIYIKKYNIALKKQKKKSCSAKTEEQSHSEKGN